MAEKKKVPAKKAVAEKKPKAIAAKEKKIAEKKTAVSAEALRSDSIVLYPLVSEKAVGMIESQNKLHFIVNPKSSKPEIRKAVEALYNVKVVRIRTVRDMKGRKKALVQLSKDQKAQDVATRIGIL